MKRLRIGIRALSRKRDVYIKLQKYRIPFFVSGFKDTTVFWFLVQGNGVVQFTGIVKERILEEAVFVKVHPFCNSQMFSAIY